MTKNEIAHKVLAPIERAGFKAYFVGGCVRDELMGKEPHDYDICTDATPTELHQIFSKFSNVSENSEPFGVTMPLIDGEEIEIATLRKDITKGRHPKIEFTRSLEEDALRRDFTVNALYEDQYGEVYDFVGGVDDCKRNLLRFVGDPAARLAEDPLRAFRFVRFLAKGFEPAYTVDEIAALPKLDFSEVSKERQLKELRQMLAGPYFMVYFDYFTAINVDEVIGLRAIFEDMKTCKQSPKFHSEGDVYEHTKLVMKAMMGLLNEDLERERVFTENDRFILMLAAMLHDIGKAPAGRKNGCKPGRDWPDVHDHDIVGAPIARDFAHDLGLTNKEVNYVGELTRLHMRMHTLGQMTSDYKVLRITSREEFPGLVMLAKADEMGCVKTVEDDWIGIHNTLQLPRVKHCIEMGAMPKQIITGNDLTCAGLVPGPYFKHRLETAHKYQIDKKETRKDVLLKVALGTTSPKVVLNGQTV